MALRTELLKGVLDKEPFINRTVFGSAVSCSIDAVRDFKCKNIAVLGNDGDYLFCGKAIRDGLIEKGFKTDALIYDNEADISLLIRGYDALIVVGDGQIILSAAYACKRLGCFCVGVPCKGVFADIFAGRVVINGALDVVETGLPNKIVLDDGIFKSLKKNALADGFCFVCSKAGEWAEYLADCELLKKEPSLECKAAIDKGLALLKTIKEENAYGVIFVSQIYIARAVYLEPDLSFGGSFYVAKVLSSLKGISLNEAVNSLIAPLLKFYKLYLGMGELFFAPRANEDVEKLSEILKCKEYDIYKKYSPLSFEEIRTQKSRIDERVFSCFDVGMNIVEGLKARYKEVYRGRKRRDNFSLEDFKKALTGGGLLSKGLLKLAYDDGACSLVSRFEN